MNSRFALSSTAWARALGRSMRVALIAAAVALVLLAAIYVAARAYLPALVADKARLEAQLSERVRHPVRLRRVALGWDGPYPRLRAEDVTVHGDTGDAVIRIEEVRVRLDPLALLRGRVELHRLVLVRPSLTLARAADGRIGVAGLAPRGGERAGAGLAWLLAQPRLVVRDGDLHWRDAREPDAPLSLARIALSVRKSGERHRVSAQAGFPAGLCGRCALSAELSGLEGGDWRGEIELDAQDLELARLPLVLRERLPVSVQGRLDARLVTDWAEGRLRAGRGSLDGERLRWHAAGSAPIGIARLAGEVGWETLAGGWRLDASELLVGFAGAPWPAGRLRFEYGDTYKRIELEHLVLDDLAPLLAAQRTHHPWLERLAVLAPSGAVHEIEAEVSGRLAAPNDYRLQARLDNVSFNAYERVPGVRGLTGPLALEAERGSLALESTGFELDLPTVFRAPLQAGRARGLLSWHRTPSAWHVIGADLAVQAPDAAGNGRLALELPHDRARSPVLDLRVDFRDAEGAHASRYYPAHKLPPRVLAWMESAFIGGRITAGHLIYDGPIRAFPFERGEGRFALQAEVRDAVYRYLPGWTPLTDVEASVAIEGADARITGRGRIGALAARDVEVTVGRAGTSVRAVRVHGVIEGPIAETVRVLRTVKSAAAPEWRGALAHVEQASGRGRLDLRAQVALGGGKRSFRADYRFDQAAFVLAHGTRLESATGALRVSEAGLQDGRLQARAYGGSFSATARRTGAGLSLEAEGDARAAELLRDRGALAQRADGAIGWTLAWEDAGRGPRLRFQGDLSRVRTHLPAPLDDAGGGLPRRVIVTTEESSPTRMTLALDAGPEVGGRLLLTRVNDAWRLSKGRLDVGRRAGRLPPGEGLELGMAVDSLDLDGWLPLLRAGQAAGGAGGLPVGVSAQIKRLILLERNWGRVFLNLVRRGAEWRAVIDGDAAAGEATLVPGGAGAAPATIRLDLAYLRLPSNRNSRDRESVGPDPRRLPRIDMDVRSFEHKQRRFGELVMRASPYAKGWRIERLSLERPETALSLAGTWEREPPRDTTRLSLELESGNLGEALDAWGIRGQMRGGRVKLQGNLSWPGTPARPGLDGLDGRVEISAENGRFLQLDPGAARLFGLLDLRAISRYLTLDFSPALAQGLVFDAIHSTIAVEQGNASTDAFILSGPSLNLHAAGRVGLAREDYDLRLDVSPRVSDTLTLTSWGLFGPQAAAAVLAFQRLFRRQIEESTRISYTIKGPWEHPDVTRLPKPGAASLAPAPTP